MSLNKLSTNFYCSKDNAFAQYMKQKFQQKQDRVVKTDIESFSQPQQNNSSGIHTSKHPRQDKSVGHLVQFFGSPKHVVSNSDLLTEGQKQNTINNNVHITETSPSTRQKQNGILYQSPQIKEKRKEYYDNNDYQIPNALSAQGKQLKSLPNNPGSYRQYLSQSVDNNGNLQNESNQSKQLLPSKFFNSPAPKHSQNGQSQIHKGRSSKIMKEILTNKQNHSNLNHKNLYIGNNIEDTSTKKDKQDITGDRSKKDHIMIHSTVLTSPTAPLLKPLKPADFHLPNVHDNSSSIFKTPQNSHQKVKIQKNYFIEKINSLKHLTTSKKKSVVIEKDFTSPFGDSQFDLFIPSYPSYSKKLETSETKEKKSKMTIDIQTPTSNNTQNLKEKMPTSPLMDRIQQKQNKYIDEQQAYQLSEKYNQPESKLNINLKKIENHKLSTSNQISMDNFSPSNVSSSRGIEIKSDRQGQGSSPQNEIAYDRFTLNKQLNQKIVDLKKKEKDIKNNNLNVEVRQKQTSYQQNSKKKELGSQLSVFSNYCDDSNSQILDTNVNTSKPQIIHLPPISTGQSRNQSAMKSKNVKSMSEIILISNRNGGSQIKIEIPKLTAIGRQPSLGVEVAAANNNEGNNEQNSETFQRVQNFKRNIGRKQTDILSYLDVQTRKKNKLARMKTVDINSQIFNNELKNRFAGIEDQLQLNSENPNYYQALMNLKLEQEKLNQQSNKKTARPKSLYSSRKPSQADINEDEDEDNAKQKQYTQEQTQQHVVQFEQELIESIRHLKQLISEDQQMKIFIQTFCFIEVEEFCFLLGIFLDSIYDISPEETTTGGGYQNIRAKEKSQSLQRNVITTQRSIILNDAGAVQASVASMTNIATDPINEQQILTQSIKLPQYGIDRIETLLKESFIKANVSNLEKKLKVFRDNQQPLLPDNLLDEIGGRNFIERVFVIFFEDIINSKEFLRDCYEEQYSAIINKINHKENNEKYIQIVCEFLKESSDHMIPETLQEKIKKFGIQLSSIDFFILKKRLYHFLLGQKLVITQQQILKIISRLDQLRQVICTDVLFIRNPDNLERHIFLSLKSFLVSSSFLKSVTTQCLNDITANTINYITSKASPSTFITFLYSVAQEEVVDKLIDSIEFVSTQAFEIYSYLSVEDRADLKAKFTIIKQKLGIEKYISQVLPAPLKVILNDLKEWVQTQITDEPLPKEILLKNLENTELLEIIIEFSHPDISAFNCHDSFAAFSYYSITKLQYEFWVRGFLSILTKYKTPQPHINIAENFLKQIFPDRQKAKESNFKLNKHSELMYDQQFKAASQQRITVNITEESEH